MSMTPTATTVKDRRSATRPQKVCPYCHEPVYSITKYDLSGTKRNLDICASCHTDLGYDGAIIEDVTEVYA